jgi:hypothetical protein
VADIHGEDARGTMLQQAIGESSGRGTQVDRIQTIRVEGKMAQGVFELMPAAADIFVAGCDLQNIPIPYPIAGFAGGLAVDPDLPGHDGTLRLLAALRQAALVQGDIKAFHGWSF